MRLRHPSRQVKSSLHFVDLVFCSEIGNSGKYKDVNVLPNFKFQIFSFDIGIQFDNTRFFEKSVNWRMEDAEDNYLWNPKTRLPLLPVP